MCELDLLVEALDVAVTLGVLVAGWRRNPRDDD